VRIKQLSLRDFRNYEKFNLELDQGLNLIIGRNGIGKTNILESVVVLANTKSFRCHHDNEMIRKNCEFSRIEAITDDNKEYKIIIREKGKTLFYNNQLCRRASDYIGKINAVLFKPSDLFLFDGPPKNRRNLLDVEIGKVSNDYLNDIILFSKLLIEKNALLKNGNDSLLEINDQAIVEPILRIKKERENFFNSINTNINSYYHNLSNEDVEIKIVPKLFNGNDKNEVLNELEKIREREKYLGFSLYGPHKDDFSFTISNYPAETYASQGQKRMIMIAFKLAIVKYIESFNKSAILLLDDILSELDEANQMRLLENLPLNTQIILTGTEVNKNTLNYQHKLISLGGKNG